MPLFVQLDADYTSDPKILRAGAMAELVYVRALTLAKRLLTDGHIDAAHLPLLCLGIPGKPAKHAQALVDNELWEAVGDGWRIMAWSKRNASRAQVEAKRGAKAEAGAKGNHDRWHRERRSPDCRYCIAEGSQVRSQPDRKGNRNGSPEPEPEPETSSQPSIAAPTARPPRTDDEELRQEACRRLTARREARPDDPISNPEAWLDRTIAQLRTDGWTPDRRPQPPDHADVVAAMALPADPAPPPAELRRAARKETTSA